MFVCFRLQLQGEIAAGDANVAYRGMLGTAVGIMKEEGMLMLWRGILPGTVVTNSILLRHRFLVRKRLKRTSHLCKDPSLLSLSSHLGHSFLTLASPSFKQGRELR